MTKKYGKTTALDKVSFSVRQGEAVGILGPNGAGKTTLVSIISALRRPTDGMVMIGGSDSVKDRQDIHKMVGLVFQEQSMDPYLTASENLKMHGALFEMEEKDILRSLRKALNEFGLDVVSDVLAKDLSGGLRQRVELAKAFFHDPSIYILDEPTLGLDPEIRRTAWDAIRKLRRDKSKSILITSHYLDEIEELCDRVIILKKGRIIVDRPLRALMSESGTLVTITLSGKASKRQVEAALGLKVDQKGGSFTFKPKGTMDVTQLVRKLAGKGLKIRGIETKRERLEETYLKLVRD